MCLNFLFTLESRAPRCRNRAVTLTTLLLLSSLLDNFFIAVKLADNFYYCCEARKSRLGLHKVLGVG